MKLLTFPAMARLLIAAALLMPVTQGVVPDSSRLQLRGSGETVGFVSGGLVAVLNQFDKDDVNTSLALSGNISAMAAQRPVPVETNVQPTGGNMLQMLPLLTLIAGSVWFLRDKLREMTFHRAQVLEVLAAIAVYYISSPFVIFINNGLMNHHGFKFPVTIGNMGVLCTTIFAQTMVASRQWTVKSDMPTQVWLRSVFPIALLGAATLALGNLVYMYLSISLIQILRSGTLVMTLGFGLLAGVEKFRWDLFSAVLVIAMASATVQLEGFVGHWRTSALHAELAVGLVLNLAACGSEAGRVIMTQVAVIKLSFQDSLYWCSRAMLGVNAVLILVTEAQGLATATVDKHIVWGLIGSAIGGCVSTLSAWWLTKLVGGLSLKVLANARNYFVVTMAVYMYSEPFSAMRSMCYSVCIAGVFYYEKCRSAPVQSISNESKP